MAGVELGTAYLSLIASTGALAPSVRKGMGQVEDEAEKGGKRAGGKLAGALKVAAIAGAAAAGALVVKSFGDAIEREKLGDKTAAALGLNKKQAATAGKVSGQLYAGAWGGSMEEVNSAVESVMSSIDGMTNASPAQLKRVTAAALDIASAFDVDVDQAATNAGILMKTGLAPNAMAAMDLITAGLQKVPKSLRGEVMDATTEYSDAFANLGFTGKESMGLLVSASENGQYGIDKAGDAIKEFSIRATDMSKSTKDAYNTVGLDAGRMTNDLLAGGDRAQGAFQKIVGGIQGIKDPAKRAETAIALFGTPLEDLGTKDIPKFLDSLTGAGDGMGKVKGSAKDLGDTINDNLGTKIEGWKRSVQTFASDGLMSLIEGFESGKVSGDGFKGAMSRVGTIIRNVTNWVMDNKTLVLTLVGVWGAWKVAVLAHAGAMKVAGAATKAWAAITKGAAIAQRILNAAMRANPIGLIITAITLLVGALVWFFTKTKVGKKIITVVWAGIKAAIKGVADWWTKTAWPAIKKVITAFGKAFQRAREIIGKVWDKISDAIGTAWDWIKKNVFSKITLGLKVLRAGFVFYRDKVKAIWGKVKEILKAGWDWVRKNVFDKIKLGLTNLRDKFAWIRDKAKAIWNRLGDLLKAGWNWIRDNVFARIKAGISGVRDRFALIRDRIKGIWRGLRDGLRDGWNWIRDNVFSKIKAGVNAVKDAFGKARDGIRTIWNKLKAIAAKPINFLINTVYMGGIRKLVGKVFDWLGKSNPLPEIKPVSFATGGYTGPGGKYKPAGIVHADEYVVRKESRAKFERKNPGALDYLNRTGELPGFARGGRVGAAAKWWQDLGARVSEFGGWGQSVAPVHMKNSRHYAGKAADLNYGVTGPMEQGFFDKHVGAFRQAFPDINVLWRVPNHFNHMHIDDGAHGVRGGSVGGGGGFDFFGIIRKLGDLKKKFSGALFDSPLGGMVKDVGGEVINGPIQWIKDRFTGAVKSAGSWIKRTAASAGVNLAAGRFGWDSGAQWDALSWIINKESGWNPHAANPSSSARGLFQKMTSVHGPIEKSVMGQADWGLNYIKSRYGNPLAAKAFHESHGYYADGGRVLPKLYDQGGWLPTGTTVVQNNTGRPEPVLNPEQWASMSNAGPGVHVEQLVVADPDDAVRKLERMARRAAVRNNIP